jgi:lipoyl(octanoyl) transferase
MRRCALIKAGLVDYDYGLSLQADARRLVSDGEFDGALILVEHLPVITTGRGGGLENLRADENRLPDQGVQVISSDRGGNITCHNPGQLVGYPVMNLRQWQQDVHWYVETLEEVLIRVLARLGLRAGRKAKYTGVWIGNEKIAAIGVSARQWVTGHGFALNVNNSLDIFRSVVPCGISEFGVTSITKEGLDVNMEQAAAFTVKEFCALFDCAAEEVMAPSSNRK